MTTETRQVLDLLSQGKITADEAERLLRALDASDAAPNGSPTKARWLRIAIDRNVPGGSPKRVANLRMPVSLVRAGIKLGSLIPGGAFAMAGSADDSADGVRMRLLKIDPEQLESIVAEMGEMTIDADDGKAQVRIWCE
jgi:hypothetical protein